LIPQFQTVMQRVLSLDDLSRKVNPTTGGSMADGLSTDTRNTLDRVLRDPAQKQQLVTGTSVNQELINARSELLGNLLTPEQRAAFQPGELSVLADFLMPGRFPQVSVSTLRVYVPGALSAEEAKRFAASAIGNNTAYSITRPSATDQVQRRGNDGRPISIPNDVLWQDILGHSPFELEQTESSLGGRLTSSSEDGALLLHAPLGVQGGDRGGISIPILVDKYRNSYNIELTLRPDRVPVGTGAQNQRGLVSINQRRDASGNPIFYISAVGVIPAAERVITNPVDIARLPQNLTSTPPALEALSRSLRDAINTGWKVTSGDNKPVRQEYLPTPEIPRGSFPADMDTRSFRLTYASGQGRELMFNALQMAEKLRMQEIQQAENAGEPIPSRTYNLTAGGESITPAILDFYHRTGAQISATLQSGQIVPLTPDMFSPRRASAQVELPPNTSSFTVRYPNGYTARLDASRVSADRLDWYIWTGARVTTNTGAEITASSFQVRRYAGPQIPAEAKEFNLRWGLDPNPTSNQPPYWRTGFDANAPRPRP
jgi:hypothetical protein